MNTQDKTRWAAILNLLVPGGGFILIDRVPTGLLIGLAFVLLANWALWATLLVPDESPAWAQALGVGVSGGVYLGAQVRLAQTVRTERRKGQAALRRAALCAAQEQLRRGDFALAFAALAPVRDSAGHDLLVAYRLAQVHSGLRNVEAAQQAWRRVRTLDRHHIYRSEILAAEVALKQPATAARESTPYPAAPP